MVRSVYGFGVNDSGYKVTRKVGSDQVTWVCPYYAKWRGMLKRCYDKNLKTKFPSYSECVVCDEWKYFSNFKKWVDEQPNKNWKDCELDKDLLIEGNKIYSSTTCIFITRQVNQFLKDRALDRGECLLGVTYHKKQHKFHAYCNNPFSTKQEYLGVFNTEIEAHMAWKRKKHEFACMLAEFPENILVSEILKKRYTQLTGE